MNKKKIFEIILLLLILILGAYLRLYKIRDYLTFLGDEGRDVLVVKRMIVDHKFTLLGPTASVGGFFLGPIYYYFMMPFLWAFNLDPVGPAVMVALFGIATIYFIYKTGKDFFDPKAGLVAALFYAISPVVIAYSRASWNPNIVPFFTIIIIYLTKKIVTDNQWKKIIWLGFLFGISLQLHYLVSFLAIGIATYLIFYGRLKRIKEYFIGVLGFFLGISPFLLFEVRHGFPNTISLFNFIFHGKEIGVGKISFINIITNVSERLFSRLITNNNLPLAVILLLSTLIIYFYCYYKNRNNPKIVQTLILLLFWGVFGVGLFGFYKKPIYDYYLGFLFPLSFLLTGHLFSHLSEKLFGKILTLGLIIFIFILNWAGIPFRFPANKQLDQTINISRFVFDKTEGKPFNFALITGQNSDHAYRYFFEVWNNKPVTIENSVIDPKRKSVTSQLLVICEKIDCQPLGNSLWEIAGFDRAEIVGSWDVSVVKVYKLTHYKGN